MSFNWSDRLLLNATSLSEYLARLISCGALERMCVTYEPIHHVVWIHQYGSYTHRLMLHATHTICQSRVLAACHVDNLDALFPQALLMLLVWTFAPLLGLNGISSWAQRDPFLSSTGPPFQHLAVMWCIPNFLHLFTMKCVSCLKFSAILSHW